MQRSVTGKYIALFIYWAVLSFLILRYLVVPSDKLHSAECHIGARKGCISFDVPRACAYLIKITIPADRAAEVINGFTVLINGEVPRLVDVNKVNGGIRLTALVQPDIIKNTGNLLEVSPYPEKIDVSVSNCKKIYARHEMMYIGDFYLFFDKRDNAEGYDVPFAVGYGLLIALFLIMTSMFIARFFWSDRHTVFKINYYAGAFLFVVVSAQRCVLSFMNMPFMCGGRCALAIFGMIFVLVKLMELRSGRARLAVYMSAAREKITAAEKRYGLSAIIVFFLVVLYVCIFFYLQAVRHLSFFPSIDLNGMVQLVYNATCGRIWEMQNGLFEIDTYLRYHLQPVYLFVVPLYYLIRSNLVFYFIQTTVIALGAIPIYRIASERLGNKAFGVLFALVYLLYPSIHNCTMYGFHFEELAIGIGAFTFYSLLFRKRILFALFCFLLLSLKENIAALVFMLGLYAILRGERLTGTLIALISAAWFYACLFVIIPHYTPQGEMTYSHSFFRNLGVDGGEIAGNLVKQSFTFVQSLLTDPGKKYFLFHLFAPLAFLPALAPEILLIPAPIFAQLLLSNYVRFHDITLSYQSSIVPFLIIAAIYGLRRLLVCRDYIERALLQGRNAIPNAIFGMLVLVSVIYFALKNFMPEHRPGYFVEGVYAVGPRDVFIKKYLDRIPAEASVSAPMMYYEYLSGRRFEYNISPEVIKKFMPDIVLVNSYICWPAYGEYRYNQEVISHLKQSLQYIPVLQTQGYYIFEKRDALRKTGMLVYDYHQFDKKHAGDSGAPVYAGSIELAEDGVYSLAVNVHAEAVCLTTEGGGYDSFEYLPGSRNIARMAQSFTPPAGGGDFLDVYARRVGYPRLTLSLHEDNRRQPSGKSLLRVSGRTGEGIAYKYGWLRYNIGSVRLDPSRTYWLVLSGEGDAHNGRYEIAAFSKGMKQRGYGDNVLYQYDDDPDEWKKPYARDNKIESEEGNNIEGIVFRIVKNVPQNERIDVKIDGQPISAKSVSIQKRSTDGTIVFRYEEVRLSKGKHEIAVSSADDFQLEYVEFLKK